MNWTEFKRGITNNDPVSKEGDRAWYLLMAVVVIAVIILVAVGGVFVS